MAVYNQLLILKVSRVEKIPCSGKVSKDALVMYINVYYYSQLQIESNTFLLITFCTSALAQAEVGFFLKQNALRMKEANEKLTYKHCPLY